MADQKKQNWFIRHKIISVILIFIVLLVVYSVIFGETTEEREARERAETSQSTNEETHTNISNADAIVKISDEAIASSAEGGRCYTEFIEPDESKFASVSSMGTRATFYFVKSAEKVFASDKCNLSYTFVYSTNGDASDGSVDKFTLGTFAISRDQYSSYNWGELSGQSVGERLRSDKVLSIPANVKGQIDYADFKYNG